MEGSEKKSEKINIYDGRLRKYAYLPRCEEPRLIRLNGDINGASGPSAVNEMLR